LDFASDFAVLGSSSFVDGRTEKLPMRPSLVFELRRGAIREAAGRHKAANPRVFGSVSRGEDREGGDLDLLVDALPNATLFDLGALQEELQAMLGVPVDLLTPGDLPPRIRARVLREAKPV
jgi:predicted nucleotidyltransferase